ncbi:MAG: sensor histidine kinase [Bacillus sp. (in: Bacteria)]|nr:sensor histidine kinase [Bacillus sp. (in: firmicutes)]
MLIIPTYIGLWLLQIICILFPIVIYHSYFRKRFIHKNVQMKIFTVLNGLSIIICMTFPVSINEGYLLDFRFIPLIIAFIYGGYKVGLSLSILLIGYRFVLGGTGFYLGGLWMTVILLIAFWFILPRAEKWGIKWRAMYPLIILTISLVIFALGTQFLDDYTFSLAEIQLWFWFSILNFLTFWVLVHLHNSFKEMEEISEKVIQFEKNHTINHLLVYISQQMLSPLKSANCFLELMEQEPLTKHQSLQLIQAKSELIQAERCLEHYLMFMDDKWKEQKDMSFVKELLNVVQLMKSYAQIQQVELIYTSTAEEDVSIKGDPSMLRFALLNIIKNGIEACSPNGRVNIYLHEMLKDVYIVIEDNGIGIPKQVLYQLGKPLSSGKVNGTGLGLASTYKITESMGGRIEVESVENNGTVFSLYFPKWSSIEV